MKNLIDNSCFLVYYTKMDSTIFRIIDANLNRASEGLRVVEEVARFVLCNESLTKEIKAQRHKLAVIFKNIALIKHRDTSKDLGKYGDFDEFAYKNLQEISHRNLKRAQEGCRVLEEFSKLFNEEYSKIVKEIRFKIYDIEKKITKNLEQLKI